MTPRAPDFLGGDGGLGGDGDGGEDRGTDCWRAVQATCPERLNRVCSFRFSSSFEARRLERLSAAVLASSSWECETARAEVSSAMRDSAASRASWSLCRRSAPVRRALATGTAESRSLPLMHYKSEATAIGNTTKEPGKGHAFLRGATHPTAPHFLVRFCIH